MTPEEAADRAESDLRASRIIDQLRVSSGDAFAGGWIAEGKANVGITDQALVDAVAAAGANPVIMANSLSELEKAKDAIDHVLVTPTASSEKKEGIAAWYVDVVANKVVIEALEESRSKAQDVAAQAGVAAKDVEVRTVDRLPTVLGPQ